MVLGFQDTSLAVEAQRAPAKAHSSRSSSANGDDAERSRLRLALFDTVSRPWSSVELGRAYGRVLAHEVIHAIAYDRGHADSGLMAPSQNRHVLTSVATEVDAVSAVASGKGWSDSGG